MKSYTQTAKLLKVRCKTLKNFFVSSIQRLRPAAKQVKVLGKKAYPYFVRSEAFLKKKSRPLVRRLDRQLDQCRPFSKYLHGPVRLFTAQFNRRNALFIIALCVPALMAVLLVTLPGALFPTPQHNEYFEFARELKTGGDRWLAMGLAACCTIFCFAMPCEDYPGNKSEKA